MKPLSAVIIFVLQSIMSAAVYSDAHSDPLVFSPAINVYTSAANEFAQVESSGRRSIAVSGELVAIVWTVSSKDASTVFVAYLLPEKGSFTKPTKLSRTAEAFEPTISGLADGRFLVAWEENDKIWLRVVSEKKMGKVVQLSKLPGKQVSLHSKNNDSVAVWAQTKERKSSITISELRVEGYRVFTRSSRLVDGSTNNHAQFYPVVTLVAGNRVVAWEDRREGLTHIVTATSSSNKSFTSPRLLNQFSPSPSAKYGRGSGAMRVALAAGGSTVAAAWLDKRDFRGGYDVFSSLSHDAGKTFSADELVQDQFGENQPQWHASVAIHRDGKTAAVAWDDARNDSPDVFYSLRKNGEWGDDFELPGGDGPGRQTHPSILFDEQGVLHVVWQAAVDGTTHVRYSHSIPSQ